MARIRTIKPEFWTDPKTLECSPSARLLFIGLLNFADDQGNIERHAKMIKSLIFPVDDLDVEVLLMDLWACRLVEVYTNEGRDYLHIKGFLEHQKIDRPAKPRYPLHNAPESEQRFMNEYDENLRRVGYEPSLPKGKDRKGKEGRKTVTSTPPAFDPMEFFEERWLRYKGPKDGKKKAQGHWRESIKKPEDLARYDQAEANYYRVLEEEANGGFERRFKIGKTWFNNWQDYEVVDEPARNTGSGTDWDAIRAANKKAKGDQNGIGND